MGQNCQITARPNRQCHQKPLEFDNAPKIRTRRATTPFEDQHYEGNEIHSKNQIYLCNRARAIEIIFNEFHKLQATQQQQQGQTQNTSQSANSGSRKENDWNNSDTSNHSQIAISTQKGDFLVEQIKNGAGDQSTYFLSPINSNRIVSTVKREPNTDYSLNPTGEFLVMSDLWLQLELIWLCFWTIFSDENVIGLSLQEILPDNNIKAEKMLVSNPPNILKRAKTLKMENAVSECIFHSSY